MAVDRITRPHVDDLVERLDLQVRERVRPFRIAGALRAFATIELPAGDLGGGVRPGDTLALRTGQ